MVCPFYAYYAVIVHVLQPDCGLHKFFVSFNMILCIIISIASILPKIQEGWFCVVYVSYVSISFLGRLRRVDLIISIWGSDVRPYVRPSVCKMFFRFR